MATEDEDNNPPADPPADPPVDAPADPPHNSANDELGSLVRELTEKVDTLTARVESLATANGERDETPVRRPWIYRGRR